MYVCMYVMYICMYVCIHPESEGKYIRNSERTGGQVTYMYLHICMHACMRACIHECMYTQQIYIHPHTITAHILAYRQHT